MRNFLKFFVVPLVIILVPAIAMPVLVLAAAAYAYNTYSKRKVALGADNAVDRWLEGRVQKRQMKRQEKQTMEERRARAVEYDRKGGWIIGKLPEGMQADFTKVDPNNPGVVPFRCAGIDGLVTGVAKGKDVDYFFKLDDLSKEEALARKAALYNGSAKVVREADGLYVHADHADAINELAKAAYPESKHVLESEIVFGRHFVVDGCSSYDEAVEKFKANRGAYSCAETYCFFNDTIDGKLTTAERNEGKPFGGASLPLGSYVVTEEEVSLYRQEIAVPGNLKTEEEIKAFVLDASSATSEHEVKDDDRVGLHLKDGTLKDIPRTFRDENGKELTLHGPDDKLITGSKVYLVCKDMDTLSEVLNGGEIPSGSYVVMERNAPAPGPGEFVLEVDNDGDLRSMLSVQGGASPAFVARCESMGVSTDQLDASRLCSAIESDGYAALMLKEAVSLDKVKVNGVRVDEIAERMSNDRLTKLDRKTLGQWIEDAGKIESVTLTVDPKMGSVRIESVVDGVHRLEERPMSEKEMRALGSRGMISRSELKDLLMQLNPGRFGSYRDGRGGGVFLNPFEAFVDGKKPVLSEEYRRVRAEARKASASQGQKQNRSSKLKAGVKHSV